MSKNFGEVDGNGRSWEFRCQNYKSSVKGDFPEDSNEADLKAFRLNTYEGHFKLGLSTGPNGMQIDLKICVKICDPYGRSLVNEWWKVENLSEKSPVVSLYLSDSRPFAVSSGVAYWMKKVTITGVKRFARNRWAAISFNIPNPNDPTNSRLPIQPAPAKATSIHTTPTEHIWQFYDVDCDKRWLLGGFQEDSVKADLECWNLRLYQLYSVYGRLEFSLERYPVGKKVSLVVDVKISDENGEIYMDERWDVENLSEKSPLVSLKCLGLSGISYLRRQHWRAEVSISRVNMSAWSGEKPLSSRISPGFHQNLTNSTAEVPAKSPVPQMAITTPTASQRIQLITGQSTSAATDDQVSFGYQVEVEFIGDGYFHAEMFQEASENKSSLKRKRKYIDGNVTIEV